MKKVLLRNLLRTTILFIVLMTMSKLSIAQERVAGSQNYSVPEYSQDELSSFLTQLYDAHPDNKFVASTYKLERILENESGGEHSEEYLNSVRIELQKAQTALRDMKYLMDQGADFHKALQVAKSRFKENTSNFSDISD